MPVQESVILDPKTASDSGTASAPLPPRRTSKPAADAARQAVATMPVGLYEKALPASWSWDQRLAAAAATGYDFVEISIDESFERLDRLCWPEAARADLRRSIAATGVPIFSMCLSGHRKYPLGSRSPEVRAQANDIMRRAIEFSADIGIRIVQVAGYDVFYEESDDDTVAHFLEGLHQAAELASQAGVMLALENVDTPLTKSMARCMEIVRQIDSLWFQIYPDMANAAAAGYDPVTDLATCNGHLVALHVKDGLPGVIRECPLERALCRSSGCSGRWRLWATAGRW